MKAFAPAAVLALVLAGCVGPADSTSHEQGRIDGAVVDQLLNPWGETVVHLVGEGRTDTTNDLGGFTFGGLAPGTYTVEVRRDGGVAARENVTVHQDDTSRVILQVHRPPEALSYVAVLRHEGRMDLAVSGQDCPSCTWSAPVKEPRPDHVYVEARWDDKLAGGLVGETRLLVELRDDAGRLVLSLEGASPLQRFLHGGSIPMDTDHIQVHVRMHPDNEVPHPAFRMQSMLCFYYDVDPDGGRC